VSLAKRNDSQLENEGAVLDRAREGDSAAFELLYRAHVGRVYATCLRLSGERESAEELTQDVFVRCWTKIGTFEGRSRFSSWLYRIAANLAVDRLRARSRVAQWESVDEEVELRPDPRPESAPELGLALDQAIASLPIGARTVFILHDVEGYRHAEIGDIAGIAAGTSKAQLHRARRLLREMLR
jgi:RNA polymerase sigma-70 factor (ECF subfamily)